MLACLFPALLAIVPLIEFPARLAIPEHAKLAALATLFAWIGAAALFSQRPLFKGIDRITLWLALLFVLLLGVSTALSAHPIRSLIGVHYRYNGLLLHVVYLGLMLFAAFTVREIPRLPQKMAMAILLAGTLTATIGAAQFWGYDLLGGFDPGVRVRPSGTLSFINLFAGYMVVCLPIAWVLALRSRQNSMRLAAFLAILLMTLGLRAAASRGCWLAAGAAIGLVIFWYGYWRVPTQRSKRLTIAHACLLLSLAAFFLFPPERYVPGLQALTGDRPVSTDLQNFIGLDAGDRLTSALDGQDLTRQSRFTFWKAALQIAGQHPWFGSGPDTFAYFYQQLRPPADVLVYGEDGVAHDAHNIILHNAATWGALPTLAWLALIMRVLWLGLKTLWHDPRSNHWLGAFCIVAIAGHALQLLVVGSLTLNSLLWVSLGVLLGQSSASPAQDRSRLRGLRTAVALLLITLTPLAATLPLRANAHLTQAEQLAQDNHMQAALKAYADAYRLFPYQEELGERYCAALLAQATTQQSGPLLEQAQSLADRLIQRWPLQSRFHALRGRIAMINAERIGEEAYIQTAYEHFQQACRLHPAQPIYQGFLGEAAARLGQHGEARRAFQRALLSSQPAQKTFYQSQLDALPPPETD